MIASPRWTPPRWRNRIDSETPVAVALIVCFDGVDSGFRPRAAQGQAYVTLMMTDVTREPMRVTTDDRVRRVDHGVPSLT